MPLSRVLCCLLLATTLAAAQTAVAPARAAHNTQSLRSTIEAITQEPAVARAHWGISVTKLDGTPLLGINDGQYFQPASNAKLFTTAAAMALLPMDERLRTRVIAIGKGFVDGVLSGGELILQGNGDANFSGRLVPYRSPVAGASASVRDELRYINELAAQIKANGIRRVEGDIRGDDANFPFQPYPPDWSYDDLLWYYGAPVNALMVADNSITVTITPGRQKPGTGVNGVPAAFEKPTVTLDPDLPYYELETNELGSFGGPGAQTIIDFSRTPGSRVLHIRGNLPPASKPYVQAISIDDPAEYAALALKRALERQGVPVMGKAYAKHGAPAATQDDAHFAQNEKIRIITEPALKRQAELFVPEPDDLLPGCAAVAAQIPDGVLCKVAEHLGPALYEDVVVTNKVSQNQHAELFLRLLAKSEAFEPSTANGAVVVKRFLTQEVGVDPQDFYLNDGSGLSGHDLVTPRAATKLLSYATSQPWGERWKASLPIGGEDGSLRNRFPEAPLKDHVFAKTGTLGEARALSGYLDCRSGQTVAFSIMVSTHTPLTNEDQKAMDRIVGAVAAAN